MRHGWPVFGFVALILFTLVGCASPPTHQPEVLKPMSSLPPGMASTGTASPPVVSVIGYSVQRRPIEMRRFGDGAHPVLIMGAIHGSETGAATLAHGFAEELAKHPELTSGVPVVVIPIANPDGYAAQTRVNANKVDLNRNFPASNWNTHARRPNNFGGQSSASEPETIALMQTIEQLQPRLIISIHSMENPCNNYDGPAQHIAEVMSRYNGFPPTPTIGYPTPGSLGAWAGIDRKIPMITLELPRTTFDAKMWTSNRDAISAAISMVK